MAEELESDGNQHSSERKVRRVVSTNTSATTADSLQVQEDTSGGSQTRLDCDSSAQKAKALRLEQPNDFYEHLLKDTDGNKRGSFLKLADNDRKVLVMLHEAYKQAEKTKKLRTVGRFKNLLHLPLEDPGFPVGRGNTFSIVNRGDDYDVPQLETFISGKIKKELEVLECKYFFLMARSAKRLLLYLLTLLLSPL
jgi:hypothetical protein